MPVLVIWTTSHACSLLWAKTVNLSPTAYWALLQGTLESDSVERKKPDTQYAHGRSSLTSGSSGKSIKWLCSGSVRILIAAKKALNPIFCGLYLSCGCLFKHKYWRCAVKMFNFVHRVTIQRLLILINKALWIHMLITLHFKETCL